MPGVSAARMPPSSLHGRIDGVPWHAPPRPNRANRGRRVTPMINNEWEMSAKPKRVLRPVPCCTASCAAPRPTVWSLIAICESCSRNYPLSRRRTPPRSKRCRLGGSPSEKPKQSIKKTPLPCQHRPATCHNRALILLDRDAVTVHQFFLFFGHVVPTPRVD